MKVILDANSCKMLMAVIDCVANVICYNNILLFSYCLSRLETADGLPFLKLACKELLLFYPTKCLMVNYHFLGMQFTIVNCRTKNGIDEPPCLVLLCLGNDRKIKFELI